MKKIFKVFYYLFYLFDFIILPKETRVLWKINKLASRVSKIYEAEKLSDDQKIFMLMDIQLLIDSIETVEHKDKKNYWLYFINLYITIIEKRKNNIVKKTIFNSWIDIKTVWKNLKKFAKKINNIKI